LSRGVHFRKKGERGFIVSRAASRELEKLLYGYVLEWAAGSDVSEERLADLLRNGTPEQVALAIMPPEADINLLGEYEQVAGQIIDLAGGAQWKDLGLDGSFDLMNPYSPQWMRTHGGELITEISSLTRYAIREEVARAFEQGRPPRDIAHDIGLWAGLRTDQALALDAYGQGLRDQGVKGDRYDALMGRRASQLRDDRGLLIARTETLNAHGHGTLQAWQVARDDGLIGDNARKKWIAAVESGRTCDICVSMDGQAVELDAPFTIPAAYRPKKARVIMAPTAHPRCRCAIGLEFT